MMYEDLYMPLPDPDRYLERTGIRQRKQPDLEWLNEILWAHQTTVPFENIMIYDERQPVSLGIPALYDKIVIRRRGGYCFELNGLLARALSDLGYEVQTCAVKIVRGKSGHVPVMHEGILVFLDGELYYCDVGNGGHQPACACLVRPDAETDCRGDIFRVTVHDQYWRQLSRLTAEGTALPQVRFCLLPMDPVDFLFLNEHTSLHPDSIFTRQHYLQRRLPEGSVHILDRTFTLRQKSDGKAAGIIEEVWEIGSAEELRDLVVRHFLPDLPEEVALRL